MPEILHVNGYEKMKDMLHTHENSERPIYLYFFGEKDDKGISWCPDCVIAEPIIMDGIRNYAVANALIIAVDVGNREFFSNKAKNPFDKPPMAVTQIPTMLHWKSAERLEGDQLTNESLLEMFFEAN